jgi:hypothetical protein
MHYEERVCFAVTLPPPTRLSAIGYDQVRLVSIREHQASGVTGAYSGLRVENFISSYTAIRPGWQLVVDAHTAGPTHVCFGPIADKRGCGGIVR